MKARKDFSTQKEFQDYLFQNKSLFISKKRDTAKHSDPISGAFETKGSFVDKSEASSNKNNDTVKIVANTYNWLDSHGDVHQKNIFKKSINENKGKIWHLHDHLKQITAQVGRIQKIEEVEIEWKKLGVDLEGTTTSLLVESKLDKNLNPEIFNLYKSGEINQHSVSMNYTKIELAVNVDIDESSTEEEKEARKLWEDVYPTLGNPEEADKKGYFWVVKEAKLTEVSCVLVGSNPLTPTLKEKKPSKDTSNKTEPSKDTQETFLMNFIN